LDEWISKKELLEATGISYGQLYRWKRECLIPDAWFVKRAAFTGQETYFPRERILARVKFILENKEKYSLQQLQKRLSPDPHSRSYAVETLAMLAGDAARSIGEWMACERLNHTQAVCALIAANAQEECALTNEETSSVALSLLAFQEMTRQADGMIVLIRYRDEILPLHMTPESKITPSAGAKVIFTLPMSDIAGRYTQRLNDIYEEENP